MKKSILFLLLLLSISLATRPVYAEETDAVLQATADEMNRTMKELHSSSGQKPFFLSFIVRESEELVISGSLGAISRCSHKQRGRCLNTDLRVGSYELDSSDQNQANADLRTNGVQLTTEDNYGAIRRTAWIAADEAFSHAIKNLETKKSWLKAHYIKNRLPDLSAEKPSFSVTEALHLKVDKDSWLAKVRRLSAIYRDYPQIEESVVMLATRVSTRWIVNSDGTRIRNSVPEVYLFTGAMTEPADGLQYFDCDTLFAPDDSGFPSDADLEKWVKNFASRCVECGKASLAEDYSGPILFEGQAGAVFFSNLLSSNLASENLRSGDSGDAEQSRKSIFKNSLGKRIMPKYLSVVDDPTLASFGGQPLTGHYTFDDDGIPAQKVSLVENGVLKAFCTSREPIKGQLHSNGHSFTGIGTNSILSVSASKSFSQADLRKKLIALGEEEGLDYVLVCKRVYSPTDLEDFPSPWQPSKTSASQFSAGYLCAPQLLYRLYLKDGHEELIKGAQIKSYDARLILKDIQAVGDDAKPYLVQRFEIQKPLHIIAPSVLLRQIDIEHDEDKIPECIVASPLKK